MVTSMIYSEKTCDLDQRAHRIWHVRRQLILGIWVMILTVLAFIEVSTIV